MTDVHLNDNIINFFCPFAVTAAKKIVFCVVAMPILSVYGQSSRDYLLLNKLLGVSLQDLCVTLANRKEIVKTF